MKTVCKHTIKSPIWFVDNESLQFEVGGSACWGAGLMYSEWGAFASVPLFKSQTFHTDAKHYSETSSKTIRAEK